MNPARLVLAGFAAIALAAACGPHAARAQAYPGRPVKIIVPTPPGGPVDVVARITANDLQGALGQPFVIENRAGAGNTIGSKDAAEATPDGYTLLYSSASGLVIAPLLHADAGYDALTSYDPIALVAAGSNILVVNPSVPAKTVAELVAYAKANPGKVNFSSGGIGVVPHLIGEMFKAQAGIDIVHVPYKGGGPSIARSCRRQRADDIRGNDRPVALDRERPAARARGDDAKAHPATAGRADNDRKRLSELRDSGLDGTARSRAHAATHRRQTQCGDQCRPANAADAERAFCLERCADGRHAGRFHRANQIRHRQMVADHQNARARSHGTIGSRRNRKSAQKNLGGGWGSTLRQRTRQTRLRS